MASTLQSWNDGPTKQAIIAFVDNTSQKVPVAERMAVFDNDGTLWVEKPLPIQAMLRFANTSARPGLRLHVLHDDAEREFDYVAGTERALDEAKSHSWTVVSIKNDWSAVFADADK